MLTSWVRKIHLSQLVIVLATSIILFVVLSVSVPGFLSVGNLLTLVQNVGVLGILGMGMAVVVIGRGIDVSIVATAAVVPALILQLSLEGYSVWIAIVIGILVAGLFGLLNGLLIAFADVPALFVTLASGLFLAGLGQWKLFDLVTVEWSPALNSLQWIGRGSVLGVPMPAIMLALMSLLIGAFLNLTETGLFIRAIGVNSATAKATGLRVRKLVVLQYIVSALIGAFGGFVLAASIGGAPTRIFDSTLVYDVILVIVLGGTSLIGGRGGATNVVAGTLLVGTLLNSMTILNLSFSAQNLIKGVVLLLTIIIDSVVNKRNEETAQHGDI